ARPPHPILLAYGQEHATLELRAPFERDRRLVDEALPSRLVIGLLLDEAIVHARLAPALGRLLPVGQADLLVDLGPREAARLVARLRQVDLDVVQIEEALGGDAGRVASPAGARGNQQDDQDEGTPAKRRATLRACETAHRAPGAPPSRRPWAGPSPHVPPGRAQSTRRSSTGPCQRRARRWARGSRCARPGNRNHSSCK